MNNVWINGKFAESDAILCSSSTENCDAKHNAELGGNVKKL
jgi:hypothetical protein